MAKYIMHIDVSLNATEEQSLTSKGFEKINVDLKKGAGGNSIYIWYKRGSEPITRLQITFNDDMAYALGCVGYTKIDKDLGAGAGGDVIYLWYFRGFDRKYHTPIVELDVTTDGESEAEKFTSGWEKLTYDLNSGARDKCIHLWVKREIPTYIHKVTATEYYGSDECHHFINGYIRLDKNINRGAIGPPVFIWYQPTTEATEALTDLNISTNDEERQELQQKGYNQVSVNLNWRAPGPVYLWHKQDKINKPVQAIDLLLNLWAFCTYRHAGVIVIERSLNPRDSSSIEFLSFFRKA